MGISSSDMSLVSELLSSSILTIPFPSLSESPVMKWLVVLCEGAFAYLFFTQTQWCEDRTMPIIRQRRTNVKTISLRLARTSQLQQSADQNNREARAKSAHIVSCRPLYVCLLCWSTGSCVELYCKGSVYIWVPFDCVWCTLCPAAACSFMTGFPGRSAEACCACVISLRTSVTEGNIPAAMAAAVKSSTTGFKVSSSSIISPSAIISASLSVISSHSPPAMWPTVESMVAKRSSTLWKVIPVWPQPYCKPYTESHASERSAKKKKKRVFKKEI